MDNAQYVSQLNMETKELYKKLDRRISDYNRTYDKLVSLCQDAKVQGIDIEKPAKEFVKAVKACRKLNDQIYVRELKIRLLENKYVNLD